MTTDPNAARNILLTGGRAPVTLDAARQLALAGHRVFVAESVPYHLCRRSRYVTGSFAVPRPNAEPDRYIEALAGIIQQEQIDLLVPMCEEIFFVSRGLARLSAYCRVFVDAIDKLGMLHNKWAFNQYAKSLGLSVPETRLLTSADQLQGMLSQAGTAGVESVVLKPAFSRFAANVITLDPRKAAAPQVATGSSSVPLQISGQFPWLVQDYVNGTQICTYSVVHRGRLTAHAAYAVDFTAGRGACISFSPVEQPALMDWVASFVASLQFTGQIAFDFILTEAGIIYPLECNPRATSGIHLFQPADRLDRAFLQAENRTDGQNVIVPQMASKAMLSVAMLTYGLASVRSWKRLKEWVHTFAQARNVIAPWRDPLPFLEQFPLLLSMWKTSRQHRISMLAATTFDIEWNGER